MEAYYYQRLGKQDQEIYHAMKNGVAAIAPSFSVPMPLIPGSAGNVDKRRLTDIWFSIRLDHPELFYAVNFRFRYYKDAGSVEILPDYLFEKKKIQEHQKAMKSRVEKLARPAMGLSDREKLLYIHDFICKSVQYDKLKKAYSHEIIGPLGQGVGVCEGIAKSVKVLCDALHIWCVIAICDNNPEKGIKYRHTWNIVKVDGKYYHLDVTFDNTLSTKEEIRYDYFMLSDKQLYRDHEPVIYKMPECPDGDHFYYKEKKISFTKMDEVRKRAAQCVKKGRTFLFHWRGGYLTKELLADLLKMMEEEAAPKGKHASVSLNWPQAVIHVFFEEEQKDENLLMEQANEGELL